MVTPTAVKAPELRDLDLAVRHLTAKHTSKVVQANAAGITCISEVAHEPLLLRLRAAVAGGTSRHASATLGNERIPVNAVALELFDGIMEQVSAWYLELPEHQRRHLDPADRLASWYAWWRPDAAAGRRPEREVRSVESRVIGWQHSVASMFDPPHTMELTSLVKDIRHAVYVPKMKRQTRNGRVYVVPEVDRVLRTVIMVRKTLGTVPAECPECRQRYGYDPATGDQMPALVLEYRDAGAQTVDHAVARCRSCETTWRGSTAIRSLRWDIDQLDQRSDAIPADAKILEHTVTVERINYYRSAGGGAYEATAPREPADEEYGHRFDTVHDWVLLGAHPEAGVVEMSVGDLARTNIVERVSGELEPTRRGRRG